MRYKITSVKIILRSQVRAHYRARRQCRALTVCDSALERTRRAERIELDSLFEFSALPEAKQPRKRFSDSFVSLLRRVRATIGRLLAKRRAALPLPFFSGALCAALCVCAVSAGVVVLSLFSRALAPYSTLTVPDVVGLDLSELPSDEDYELILVYENSSDVPAGKVISQQPRGGTERRIYGDGVLRVYVTVSAGRSFYTVGDLTGLSERDALLTLMRAEVAAELVREYSSVTPAGQVISTSPEQGERLYDGQKLTLRVSLGEHKRTVGVPDLYGLSEAQGASALASRGLKIGSVSYESSPVRAGKIISQQYSPYSQLESGTSVDVTISLGESFIQKKIPDLYGLTLSEARERLAAVGLVIGNIYSVSSGAPAGTVVSQTPMPDTPVTPSLSAVDVFISS